MKNTGISAQKHWITYSFQRAVKLSLVTPTKRLKKLANNLATLYVLRFSTPVNKANIDDSMEEGMSFPKIPMAGKKTNA